MMGEYPLHIIPQTGYLSRIDVDSLIDAEPMCRVLRRCDCPAGQAFVDSVPSPSAVSAHAFRNIRQMSMNLMGGQFEAEHAFWSQKGEAHKTWNGEPVDHNALISLCELSEETHLFYFAVKKLQYKSFPHTRQFQKASQKALYDAVKEGEKFQIVANGRLIVRHVPTLMNYWHVQLEVETALADGTFEPLPKSRYEDQRAILIQAIRNTIEFAADCPPIPVHLYRK